MKITPEILLKMGIKNGKVIEMNVVNICIRSASEMTVIIKNII